jgi:hypothetical protein
MLRKHFFFSRVFQVNFFFEKIYCLRTFQHTFLVCRGFPSDEKMQYYFWNMYWFLCSVFGLLYTGTSFFGFGGLFFFSKKVKYVFCSYFCRWFFLRRLIYFKLGGRDVHLPKLVGALILFASLFMFLSSVASMFDSWDALKNSEKCFAGVDIDSAKYESQVDECKMTLFHKTGFYLEPGEGKLSARQFWSALLGPIAAVFFWLAVIFLGWAFYRTGDIVLPIEEKIVELSRGKRKQ